MTRARSVLVCLVLAGATPAAAQLAGTLDMGAGTYRPERAIAGGIASIVPAMQYRSGLFELSAIGVYSDAPAGRWNFQGGTAAAVSTPKLGIFQLEAVGQAEWTSHYRVNGTARFSAGARAHLRPKGANIWVGRFHGQASSLGTRRPLQRNEIGGSARLGAVRVEFSLANTKVDRSLMFGGPDPRTDADSLASGPVLNGTKVERVVLTDAVLSGRWRIRSLDFDASLGRRFSRTTPETTIWGVSASRGISPSLALVAAAGRSGSDPVTSVPGARYFALGLRLKVGQPVLPPAPVPALAATSTAAPFRIGPPLGASREIVIHAERAELVELAGDFTDWKPVPLQPWGENAWRTLLPISPGLHRLAIRIDGGAWQAPPGTRPITNEFGGEVTEVVVE